MSQRKTQNPVPLKIVVIGGGTGNSTVLSGLKPWVGDGLTAIVSAFDDGGGTGKLRDEYEGLLAVGDLNQCLVALSNSPKEELELLRHRFHEGVKNGVLGLHGQTLGNLILAAASQNNGGNFGEALRLVGRMFNITGKVLASSHDNRRLQITLPDGRVIKGEHEAEITELPSFKGAHMGFNKETTRICEEAKQAIEEADMVVLAPGDLYTSLAPNLVVQGMTEALESANAVVLVCNLMNRSRHTVGFSALDYAKEYERIIGAPVIDRVLYNTQAPDAASLKAQAKLGSHPVLADAEALQAAGYTPVGKDLMSRKAPIVSQDDALAATRSTIRHDPDQVALALMGIYISTMALPGKLHGSSSEYR